jgi:hypothetical protein
MQGREYTLYTSLSSPATTSFWIDYNHNGNYEPAEWNINLNTWSQYKYFTVPQAAITGPTGMRVRSSTVPLAGPDACLPTNDGETEDYILDIIPSADCQGAPTAGTAIISPDPVCPGKPFTVILSGNDAGAGISISWEYFHLGNQNWSKLYYETHQTYTDFTGVLSPTMYRASVVCDSSGLSALSNVATVNMAQPAECHCNFALSEGPSRPITMVNIDCLTNVSSPNSMFNWEDFTSDSCLAGFPAAGGLITVKANTKGNNTQFIRLYRGL